MRSVVIFVGIVLPVWGMADTLTVGANQRFATIEQANKAAQPGDTIEVYPPESGVYRQPAVYVTKPGLQFIARPAPGGRIVLDGTGGNYSGRGSVPRGIFQVNPGADGVLIEGFELCNAHNGTHNAAGVRIVQACRVTVRRCDMHSNDLALMSVGAPGNLNAASDQLIEYCTIHENGDPSGRGMSHNMYLGGTSVTLQYCDVSGALTGHNVKSRAHFNLFQYNYVHDSNNREFDVVDNWETGRPESNTVLLGNLIVKRDPLEGNKGVVHFGRDGKGEHNGTLYMFNNTIVTPHHGPIVLLTADGARARLVNNIVYNPRDAAPPLAELRANPDPELVSGDCNWLSAAYDAGMTRLDAQTTYRGTPADSQPGFVDAPHRDFRLTPAAAARWAANGALEYRDGAGQVVKLTPRSAARTTAGGPGPGEVAAVTIGASLREWPASQPTSAAARAVESGPTRAPAAVSADR